MLALVTDEVLAPYIVTSNWNDLGPTDMRKRVFIRMTRSCQSVFLAQFLGRLHFILIMCKRMVIVFFCKLEADF